MGTHGTVINSIPNVIMVAAIITFYLHFVTSAVNFINK